MRSHSAGQPSWEVPRGLHKLRVKASYAREGWLLSAQLAWSCKTLTLKKPCLREGRRWSSVYSPVACSALLTLSFVPAGEENRFQSAQHLARSGLQPRSTQ